MAKLGRFSAIHQPAQKIIRRRTISTAAVYSGLYAFTTWTFTNGNSTGRLGPNVSYLRSLYNTTGNTWINNDSYFTVVGGIQYWTVPASGTYTITSAGAVGGGNVGLGAQLTSTVSLTQGEVIRIAVGQRGANTNAFYGSGGGGTFVIRSPFNSNASIIQIAGGGGGKNSSGNTINAGGNASVTPGSVDTNGKATGGGGGGSSASPGGLNGAVGGNQSTGGYPGGGGGFFGNGGGSGGNTLVGGSSWTFGANGGMGFGSESVGGFGGGGGGSARGAGGGGYNGGNAGLNTASAGGGGSYNTGTNMSNVANVNLGHGYVTVTFISSV